MKTRRSAITALGFCFLSFTTCTNASSLILENYSWNGITLGASVRTGYRQAGGIAGEALEIANSDYGLAYAVPGSEGPGDIKLVTSNSSGTPFLNVSASPDAGLAKDIAEATLTASFTVGSDTSNDQFNFDIDTLTSAELAQVDFGSGLENADAFIEVTIALSLWDPALVPGAVIETPDLPHLINPVPSVETMNASYVNYVDGEPVSNSFGPGDAGEVVGINLSELNEKFEYVLHYSIVTPYGTDPITSYSFQGAATAIPEPATGLLNLCGILLLIKRRR